MAKTLPPDVGIDERDWLTHVGDREVRDWRWLWLRWKTVPVYEDKPRWISVRRADSNRCSTPDVLSLQKGLLMSEVIDLGPEIDAVCAKLGLADKSYVSEIVFKPSHVSVTVLRGKDGPFQGSKFIDEDGEVAKDVLGFKITS